MMEKYGANVEKYEVIEPTPGVKDEYKVVANDMTQEEAIRAAAQYKDAIVRPSRT